jgi:hypothetical protein
MEMSILQMQQLQRQLRYLFADLNINVALTVHAMERLHDDDGREREVAPAELFDTFVKFHNKYRKQLAKMQQDRQYLESVIQDEANQLNVAFAIDFREKDRQTNKYRMRILTIMRKDPQKFKIARGGQAMKV